MLTSSDIIAFLATTQPRRAIDFYSGILGLTLIADEEFALIFNANGIMLRISKVESHTPAPFTVLGWDIPDIAAEVDRLAARGILFEQFSGMGQDEKGICTFPDQTRVAWFKDPDGNIMSLTQFPGIQAVD